MTPTKKRLRVVFTDGEQLVDALFVQREGNDFYFGRPGDEYHYRSYHESGQTHRSSKVDGSRLDVKHARPPEEFRGPRGLTAFGLPESSHRDIEGHGPAFTLNKHEHVVYLDVRQVPDDWAVNVTVGLVHSSAIGALRRGSTSKFHCHEVHLIPSEMEPWLFIEVGWARPVTISGITGGRLVWRWGKLTDPPYEA